MLIAGNPSIKAFANAVTQIQEADPVRVMHVDLDYVYDPNPVQQAKNIDKLVQRVYDMKISHVFLQAFSDPQGDGTVKSLYFPNRWLPMRADLFNFVSWQLQTRGGVKSMPGCRCWPSISRPICRAFSAGIRKPGRRYLPASRTFACRPGIPGFASRSPTSTKIWPGTPASAGILFHDDAVLTDFEDVSPEAVAACGRRVWGTMPARCPNVRKSARHGCVSKAKP
ncbi:outer membrane N-deacetylase [Klebsiella variicola]|nr:outer membrane N-deacetylase [Klebsiella variicola]